MTNPIINLVNINKSYDEDLILKDFNLTIQKNEFLTLLGPSGCGKTTTLRLIGGFESPDSGQIIFDGKDITNDPPYEREINTVFQKYSLFSHLNVFDNIAFGLKIKKMPKDEIELKVKEMLEVVNLKNFENRKVESLSGGQQQRVAIARALVNEPEVLLLDEPLGALDLKLRQGMQIELKRIQQSVGITFIYVTHDQEEALTMSDTIVVLKDGKIQQIGSPTDIYNEPNNAFVADFIGESNIISGVIHEDYLVEFSHHMFKCVDSGFAKKEEIDVVVRPEDIELVKSGTGMLDGVVKSTMFKGVYYEMIVEVKGFKYKVSSTISKEVNDSVGMNIDPNNIHIMKKVIK
ncbi:spermidine/putrescine transport system ATP-binding protein [Anaerosphaera aminiphila DSM 21120]|uniref:Spermidine/putrescine import ATP-binding protein PotA n=1 Tax=Anaerosphaera aminiphila DSM 21120 TaxID=1120995 RepID=A0A1M5UX75_9FIRM|nr:spermidine/putrescine ABC transporter ATP-binding protein [Anaerosphaera aminiphila]SHH67293.1 spermidine/putrescine transport system ATP-binding protein [Anaerosphaera aminiphila DSM 21120]